ncbi:MAG TPA: hypothetical protein VEZ40_02980, partial [Pyrinomonadaceae bacterium]|nr:hypothetical protein [Pyrinomonadaceae bacterium]
KNMSSRFRTQGAAAVVCLLSLLPPAPAAHAQTAAAQPKKPAAAATKTRTPGAADPLAAERRANAVSLLNTLADESRGFRDQTLRARVQTQAADALWETDRERARALFRRAWDAAEMADAENTRRGEEQNRAAGRLSTRGLNLPNLRGEVLRLAAKRERALGEEFLGKMEEARKRETSELNNASDNLPTGAGTGAPPAGGGKQQPPARRDPDAVPADVARRLQLAMQFLEDGDTARALEFADPALNSVNPSSVEFLVMLRERNAAEADRRYNALLASVALSPASDAGDILLLSSYVLTPHLYMTIGQGGQGISSSQRRGEVKTPDLPAALRVGFARAASQVLLRPLPQADQDATATGRVGTFFVISRLMPFFEQVIPEGVPALRARLAALNPDIPEAARDNLSDDLRRGLVPEGAQGDPVQESLDRAERAANPRERDLAYVRAAQAAASKGDARARDFTEKIEDADLRRQVRGFIDFALLNRAVTDKKDGLEVLRLLTASSELTPVQRTWAYTEAARLLAKDDRTRALEALESAAASAKGIDAADPDRVRSTVAVATRFFEFDRNRAWEIMSEAVKAANAAPEFTGADAGLSSRIRTGGMSMTMNFSAPVFDLTGVFQTLARDDMNRAVALAQTFTGESPRAVATLAIARAVLDGDKTKARP